MKNTLELQLRALRPPRIRNRTTAGLPELVDVWAIHRCDRSSREWAIAVKFGREMVEAGLKIGTGTLFTVKGHLDQSKYVSEGKTTYSTFIWAEEISDVVPSMRSRTTSATPDLPNFPDPESDESNPQPENHHA